MPTVCGIAALCLLAGAAIAQAEAPFDLEAALYAAGGLSAPLSPEEFKHGWEQGWNAGGGIGYRLAARSEIRTLFFYNRFALNTMGVSSLSGGEYTLLEVAVDYKLYLTGRQDDLLAVYLVGGVGFGGVTIAAADFPDPLGSTEKFTRTKPAYDVGAGVDFRVLPRLAVFAEAKCVLVQTQGESSTLLPLRAGVRFLVAQ